MPEASINGSGTAAVNPASETAGTLERLLRDERNALVWVALSLVVVASWIYTLAGVGMSTGPTQGVVHAIALLAMWWIMMIAMMLPSAASVVLLAAALNRRTRTPHQPFGATGAFVAGYLLGWLAFSVAAVALQWTLERYAQLTPGLRIGDATMSALVLLAVGAWQLSPQKHACLMHCRSPVAFLVRHKRAGSSGALVTGLHHSLYCLGCCWALMLLLFVGGIMNVWWIAGLALYVLIEKRVAAGAMIARTTGYALIAAGALMLIG